jgi:hypothetical protein
LTSDRVFVIIITEINGQEVNQVIYEIRTLETVQEDDGSWIVTDSFSAGGIEIEDGNAPIDFGYVHNYLLRYRFLERGVAYRYEFFDDDKIEVICTRNGEPMLHLVPEQE